MSSRTSRPCPQSKGHMKSSVARGVVDYFTKVKRSQRKPCMHSRSFTPYSLQIYEARNQSRNISEVDIIAGMSFFDVPISTGSKQKLLSPIMPRSKMLTKRSLKPTTKTQQQQQQQQQQQPDEDAYAVAKRPAQPETRGEDAIDGDIEWMPDFIEEMFDNSDRHAVGFSLMQSVFGSGGDVSEAALVERTKRPYFTYWITSIQVVIYILTVVSYGFAPLGLDLHEINDQVRMTTLSIQQVSRYERANMWIGPRQADLIHLGAKYTPCMRQDPFLQIALEVDREIENQTACCINNDGSGCVQSLQSGCSTTLSTWMKWTTSSQGDEGRLSGSVCGQDPKYCSSPASTGAEVWKDDISRWPVCLEQLNITAADNNRHMTCEVVGRPCCVGIQGECVISTREYCTFRRGFFHEGATLCAQVYCMAEVCGMFSFTKPNRPDQFYRLFVSLFLHAGLLQLVITLLLQMTVMRDLEKLSGWWFMTLIYLVGGVAGSLASATFIPYHVEAGPSGSQFAVLAVMFVEVLRWNKDRSPGITLLKLGAVFTVLFLMGTIFSDVDNYAHLFGFIFGWLVCMGCRPYVKLCGKMISNVQKITGMAICLLLAAGVFVILVVLFYYMPITQCKACMYFNCIPFTSTYCDDQVVTIRNATTAVI